MQDPGEAFQQADQVIDRDVFDPHRAMMQREPERSSRLRPAMFAAFALLLAAVGVGLTDVMGLTHFTGLAATTPVHEAPATAPVASLPPAPPPVAVMTKEPPSVVAEEQAAKEPSGIPPTPAPTPPKALATEPGPVAQPASVIAPAPEQPPSASPAPTPEPPQAMQASAPQIPDQQSEGTARIIVAISPGGEIYIDDKHQGTTPPLTTFDLKPGMHRIEVRSGSRKPYLTYMTLQAGDVRRIRHDFDAKRSGPPAD
jgi:hypothetical protein